ncbi:hypothetical protein D9M72_316540 [compost metagenome]
MLALGPLEDRPDKPQFRLPRQRKLVFFLGVFQHGPFPDDDVDGGLQRHAGHPGTEPAFLPFRLVHQHAGQGRHFRGIEVAECALPQRLGYEEVLLTVNPAQFLAVGIDGYFSGFGGFEVTVAGEKVADPVECLGDGVGAALDFPDQSIRFAPEFPPALRPPRVILAFAAAVAGMGTQRQAQIANPLLHVRQGRSTPEISVAGVSGCRRAVFPDRVADRRCEVLPRLGHLCVERLWYPDPGDRRDGPFKVLEAYPSQLVVQRQHRGPRFAGVVVGAEHHCEAGSPACRYIHDIAGQKPAQRVLSNGLTSPRGAAGGDILRVRKLTPQPGVFGEVAQVAGHGLLEAGQGFLPAPHLPGQAHY